VDIILSVSLGFKKSPDNHPGTLEKQGYLIQIKQASFQYLLEFTEWTAFNTGCRA
jgi:hypothetical protein